MSILAVDSPPTMLAMEGGVSLLRSLLSLSREISLFERRWSLLPQRRRVCSVAKKARVLSLIFDEILCDASSLVDLPPSVIFWFREIFDVLRRFKKLMDACYVRMSRVSLTLRLESAARAFNVLSGNFSSLLGVFPVSDFDLGDDFEDLVRLLHMQCRRPSAAVDPDDELLRREVLEMISGIDAGIVPDDSKLKNVFQRLGVNESKNISDEIERLKIEIGTRWDPKRLTIMSSLLGLLLYGNCILFGESGPTSHATENDGGFETFDSDAPADFRCPITLELMRDPVVISSGQTYDRESISGWIASGHATCPKTAQPLSNSRLVPNRALRNIIHQWCRQNGAPFDPEDADDLHTNKAPVKAVKTMIMLFICKLQASPCADIANKIVNELRKITKVSSEIRALVAEAGAVPVLVSLLESAEAHLQVNTIRALLNLSILPDNKTRIMQAAGALDALVRVLRSGATWQAKETAAATLLSLSALHALYRKEVAKARGVAEGLAELVRSGPASSQRDGLLTTLQLAGDKDNISRLVDGGVVEAALDATVVPDAAEMALAVVAAVAKRGGAAAIAGTKDSVSRLAGAMRMGTDRARETAAVALVSVCSHGGGDAAVELAAISGMDCLLWNLMQSGSERGRRTAASLCRICRR